MSIYIRPILQDSGGRVVDGVVTWLGSGKPRNHGSIPDWPKIILISKTWKLALRPTQPHSLVTGDRSWW